MNSHEYANEVMEVKNAFTIVEREVMNAEAFKMYNWNRIYQLDTYKLMSEADYEKKVVDFTSEEAIGGFSARTTRYQKDIKTINYTLKKSFLPISYFVALMESTTAEMKQYRMMVAQGIPLAESLMANKYKNALMIYGKEINDAFFYGTKDRTLRGILDSEFMVDIENNGERSDNLISFIYEVFSDIVLDTQGVVVPDFVGISSVAYSALAMLNSNVMSVLPNGQNGIQYLESLLSTFAQDYGKTQAARVKPLGELKVTVTDNNPLGDILIIDTDAKKTKMYHAAPFVSDSCHPDTNLFRTSLEYAMTDLFVYTKYALSRARFNAKNKKDEIMSAIPSNTITKLKKEKVLTENSMSTTASEKVVKKRIFNAAVESEQKK